MNQCESVCVAAVVVEVGCDRVCPVLVRGAEEIALEFGYRPHWAKRFFVGSEYLREAYPRFDDFVALRRQLDPHGRFMNEFLEFVQ